MDSNGVSATDHIRMQICMFISLFCLYTLAKEIDFDFTSEQKKKKKGLLFISFGEVIIFKSIFFSGHSYQKKKYI